MMRDATPGRSVICDDVYVLLATRSGRTLSGVEERSLHAHVESCPDCEALVANVETERDARWLSRISEDALDDEVIELPTVDPVVYSKFTELAEGGMGRVLRAFDRRLGREVAIKEVSDPGLQQRFEREVRITAKLQHPAIVPIYEAGRFPDGTAFYAMRLVPGRTLEDALAATTTLEQRLALLPHVRAMVDAVAYAHARGVIHRDLKPANVLVGAFGETVVIDWGLATVDSEEASASMVAPRVSSPLLTHVGSVMGTPGFMSPEQAAGTEVTAAADVYALGAILYMVLTGVPPYLDAKARTSDDLVAATVAGPPTPIGTLVSAAPSDLRAITERAMARDRTRRFANAGELGDELARFEAGQLLRSREYSSRALVARWLRRHRIAVAGTIVAVIAIAAVLVAWIQFRQAAHGLAIRDRGARITRIYGEVARQAYRLDRDLLQMETALEGLATATAWTLTTPPSETGARTIFWDADFADPARRPADLTVPSAYRWPVSVREPVVSAAPGVERTAQVGTVHRLLALHDHVRAAMLDAVPGHTSDLAAAPTLVDTTLRSRTSLIDYAYVALPTGVFVMWPGMASLRDDYDVRTASFYLTSANQPGRRWGAPYVDATTDPNGDELVLPCTQGVWSATGELLGVVGVEIAVGKLVETRMKLPSLPTLRVSLVTPEGDKIVDTADAHRRFVTDARDTAVEFTELELPEIAAAIRHGEEGIREVRHAGRTELVAFARMETIGWYYVVELDASGL